MENKYIVIDTETTIKCPIGSNKASPFWPGNYIVVLGWYKEGERKIATDYSIRPNFHHFLDDNYLYVGQNIPFDLMHLYVASKGRQREQMRTRQIWDIGLAEYLLTGQQHKWPSLDDMSRKYVLPVKDAVMKAYWDADTQTEDIPKDQIIPYNEQDVDNTHKIFKEQFAEAYRTGKLPLIKSQMEALLGYTEMMWNGMAVDRKYLIIAITELEKKINDTMVDFNDTVKGSTGLPAHLIDITSSKALSLIFFGGEVKYKERELQGKYKNGNDKWKLVEKTVYHKGYELNPADFGAEKGKNGYYLIPDEVLEKLAYKLHSAQCLSTYRELTKDLETYHKPTLELVMPDGCIHHNINPTATNTGRTSSSEPNLQNVTDKTKSKIKKAYVSRWDNNGWIVEADYGQLELVVLAYLSKDAQLIADLTAGVDVHSELFAEMYGIRRPSEEQRRIFKRLSFGLIYGAGIPKLAHGAQVSEGTARAFVEAFHRRYPGVSIWWKLIAEEVLRNRVPGAFHEDGFPIATSHLVMPTGRVLKFREYEIPWRKGSFNFSPTELKNYPVQSLATADIVPMIVGKLYREIVNHGTISDKCCLINTIHDSVLFDIHEDVLNESLKVIKEVMSNVSYYLNKDFNIKDFDVPITVKIKKGRNWYDQQEVEVK